MKYIQLTETNDLPDVSCLAPFKAVLVIEDNVCENRQNQISSWLVEMGGLYVMVCGSKSKCWLKSIRQANLNHITIDEMTPEQFVMITDHGEEQIRYVFWHAKKHSEHTHVQLKNIIVIHLGIENRNIDYLSIFNSLMKT